MAEIDKALGRVRAAAKRLANAEAELAAARSERDDALRGAQGARATWDEMMQASGISRPTLQKALRKP